MKNNSLIISFMLTLMLACGGGGNNTSNSIPQPPQPPQPQSVGIFRNLQPKANIEMTTTEVITISPRQYHRAILMLNGKVLIWGGDIDTNNPSIDIYDPDTETFTKSNAKPLFTRLNKTQNGEDVSYYNAFCMVNLPNGNVFIAGSRGNDIGSSYSASWEIYNPANDTIVVNECPQNFGAIDEGYYIGDNKIFLKWSIGMLTVLDLNTNIWTNLVVGQNTGSTLWASTAQDTDGNIWIIGGQLPNSGTSTPVSQKYIIKYNIKTNILEFKNELITARDNATIHMLPGGKIGIYGGENVVLVDPTNTSPNAPTITTRLSSVEIYNIADNTISTSVDLIGPRNRAESCFLQSGYTLIAGGFDSTGEIVKTELVHKYDIDFAGSTGEMVLGRFGHAITPLNNGLVLVTGGAGNDSDQTRSTAEIFDPLSALYIKYKTEQILLGDTLQLSTTYTNGVNWSILDDTSTYGSIDTNGLLTSIAPGTIIIKATAIDDNTKMAIVRIAVLPQ